MGFAAYIRKQSERDDPCGDFARDFLRTEKNPDVYIDTGYVSKLESETLYGFYKHLPWRIGTNDIVFQALVDLWKEWLQYQHIGLKYKKPEKGYVYFLKLKGENAFKIGKTKKDPIIRKSQVEIKEKVDLYLFNWLYLDNYSIIESELKNAFKKFQIQKEWYQFKHYGTTKRGKEICIEIEEAIDVYSNTDNTCKFYKKINV